MKLIKISTVFIIALLAETMIAAPRASNPQSHKNNNNNQPTTQPAPAQQQIVYAPVPVKPNASQHPDPIERDNQIDNQLFGYFISILGNFGKILLDPNDKQNVTTQVAYMVDNIVGVAHTLTKNRGHAEYKPSPLLIKKLALAILRYVDQQQKMRQAQYQHN